jgi:hypothetical protein
MGTFWTALLFGGCGIEPFETPSAYDQQRYLCAEPDLLEAEVTDCQAEPECAGVASFQGQVQRAAVRVDAMLQRSAVRLAQAGHDAPVLSRVELSGSALYFHFDVVVSGIGTPWSDEPEETEWELVYGTASAATANNFDDRVGAVEWDIRAGTDSVVLTSVADAGTIDVSFISDRRVDLQFAGRVGPVDDVLDACAVVFPDRVEIVPVQ